MWASFGLSCLRQWLALWASLGLSCIETVDPVGLLSWWGRLFSGQPRVADVCGQRGHGWAVSSLAQDCSGRQGVGLGGHRLDSFKSCPGQCVRHMVPAGAGRTCCPALRVGPLFDDQLSPGLVFELRLGARSCVEFLQGQLGRIYSVRVNALSLKMAFLNGSLFALR